MVQPLLFLLLCLPATSAFAQEQYGIVQGQVTERDTTQPVPFAQVTILNGAEVVADSLGFFRFEKVPEGKHTLLASDKDGGYQFKFITLGANQTMTLKLRLNRGLIRLRNIDFAPKSAQVSDPDSLIFQLAEIMNKNQDIFLTISGHSDVLECAEADTALSFQRAEVVRQALLQHGIPANRMETKAWGGTGPVAQCKLENGSMDEDGCARNRRVEFKVTKDVALPVPQEKE